MVEVKNAFAQEFRRCLIAHYGKVPSCARIARDFTLISREPDPISVETIRKWLLGINLPNSAKLRTLVLWLNLNISVIDEVITTTSSKSTPKAKGREFSHDIEDRLLKIFNTLNANDQEKILKIAELHLPSQKR